MFLPVNVSSMQARSRDADGNVNCEVKSSPVEATLEPRWEAELILDVPDVHDDSLLELIVHDSRTGRMIGVVGIPVQTIHRNPRKRWVKMQDPSEEAVSLKAGVVEADNLDLASCAFGVVELEHSLKWKSGLTVRQRIMEVLREQFE